MATGLLLPRLAFFALWDGTGNAFIVPRAKAPFSEAALLGGSCASDQATPAEPAVTADTPRGTEPTPAVKHMASQDQAHIQAIRGRHGFTIATESIELPANLWPLATAADTSVPCVRALLTTKRPQLARSLTTQLPASCAAKGTTALIIGCGTASSYPSL